MLYLSTTQSSQLIITPQTIITATNSFYNFRIISADGFYVYIFAPDNWSQSPYYFGFTVSVGTPSVFTGSNVTLALEAGEYNYIVTASTQSYNLTLTDDVIDVGILIVDGTSSNPTSYTQSDNNTIRVYTNI